MIKRFNSSRGKCNLHRSRIARLEQLEDRQLLAADLTLPSVFDAGSLTADVIPVQWSEIQPDEGGQNGGTSGRAGGDPNDQISEAEGPITVIPFVTSVFTIDVFEDVDMFGLNVNAGQVVGIDIDRVAGSSLDSHLRLFDASGNELAADANGRGPDPEPNSTHDSYLEYRFDTAGTYYIGVSSAFNFSYDPVTGNGDVSSTTTGEYQLILHDLGTDNNGTIGTAFPLEIGEVVPSGTINPSVDIDMNSFSAAANQRVLVSLDVLSGNVDGRLRLFDASGNELAEATGSPDVLLAHTFASAGTYYVGVTGAGINDYDPITGVGYNDDFSEQGTYDILLMDPDGNDQLSEAPVFPLGQTTGVFTIDSTTDVDMLRFNIAAGQRIGFRFRQPTGQLAGRVLASVRRRWQ